MYTKKKPHLLALGIFFTLSAVLIAGCSCSDDDFDGATACQKLVDAANGVLASCMMSAAVDTDVCSFSTGNCVGYLGCSPKVDVDACVNTIKAASCDGVSTRSWATVTECAAVLDNIETACSSSGDSDFD